MIFSRLKCVATTFLFVGLAQGIVHASPNWLVKLRTVSAIVHKTDKYCPHLFDEDAPWPPLPDARFVHLPELIAFVDSCMQFTREGLSDDELNEGWQLIFACCIESSEDPRGNESRQMLETLLQNYEKDTQ